MAHNDGDGNAGRSKVDFGQKSLTLFPIVTSGFSFLNDIFDVTSCQIFYNSDILRFMDVLLGLEIDDGTAHGTVCHSKVLSGRLTRIPVPEEMVNQDYGYLFETLLVDFEAVPFALYRYNTSTEAFYVYNMPNPKTVLRSSDYVFILAPVHTITRILTQYPPSKPPPSQPMLDFNAGNTLNLFPTEAGRTSPGFMLRESSTELVNRESSSNFIPLD